MIGRRELLAAGFAAAAGARASAALGAGLADSTTGACRLQALDSLLSRRRMVRVYRAEPVSDAQVRCVIDAATRAPSAGNTQPWEFVVVREQGGRTALAHAAFGQMFVASAPVIIVSCADLARSRARYAARGDQYGLIDASFASLLLLLAVAEEGLGACFVGAFDDAEVARVLRLPAHVKPVGIIPIGVPGESPKPFKRRTVRDVVHEETWEGRSPTPAVEPE